VDTLPPGETSLVTSSQNIEDDLNANRSQISKLLSPTGTLRFYDDIPTVNGKKRAVKELNEDLDAIERILPSKEIFVPTVGQTVFTLSKLPLNTNSVDVHLNGQELNIGQSFVLVGTILTINLSYQLNPNFRLVVKYNYFE
jgi:hypothetical protein